jgi:hypothetical protein
MNGMLQPSEPSPGYGGRRARADGFLGAGRGYQAVARLPLPGPAGVASGIPACRRPRAPPGSLGDTRQRQGRWVAPPALIIRHEDRDCLRRDPTCDQGSL